MYDSRHGFGDKFGSVMDDGYGVSEYNFYFHSEDITEISFHISSNNSYFL
ncbi:Uncharacterised protein [Serratia fonticola]|nr:Uncharacterised protein [Serratia fonticola]